MQKISSENLRKLNNQLEATKYMMLQIFKCHDEAGIKFLDTESAKINLSSCVDLCNDLIKEIEKLEKKNEKVHECCRDRNDHKS